MFVLDTNTLVDFFRGQGNVAQRLLATPPADIAIPAVVVFELETGIAKSTEAPRRRAQFDALLRVVTILPFGMEEAKSAAALRARLEREGNPIGPMDTLIAGTALAHRGILVTRNVREFGRVPGLAVENWFSEPS